MPVELIVGAAVGAAVASPTSRRWVRRGLVYGLVGALTAYDRIAAVGKGMVQGVRHGVEGLREEAADLSQTPSKEAAPKAADAPPPSPTPASPPA